MDVVFEVYFNYTIIFHVCTYVSNPQNESIIVAIYVDVGVLREGSYVFTLITRRNREDS